MHVPGDHVQPCESGKIADAREEPGDDGPYFGRELRTWLCREKYDQSSLDKSASCIIYGRGRRARRDVLLPMESIRGGKEIPA
jgi:hypothetical protein